MSKLHQGLILAVLLSSVGCTPGAENTADHQNTADHEGSAPSAIDPEPSGEEPVVPEPPEDGERGPVRLFSSTAHLTGPTQLSLDVPSCRGRPVVDEVVESRTEVRIRVITGPGSSDDCLDEVVVSLLDPLGDRAVIDDVSQREIPVTGR